MELLRRPEFRALLLTRLFDALSSRSLDIVIGFELYRITKNPLSLGILGLVEAIPALTLALFGGHLADRIDRRLILLTARVNTAVCALVLAFVTANATTVVPIYVLVFIVGVVRGLSGAAAEAFAGQVMPLDKIVQASSLASVFGQGGSIVGAAFGGVLLAKLGSFVTCLTASGLSLLAFFALASIPKRPIPIDRPEETIWESLRAGVQFVFKNQFLVGTMALDLFAVLFGGAIALLPIFANDILKVGAQGFGLLNAAPSVGAMLAMAVAVKFPPKRNAGRDLMLCVAGFGVTMIVFALSKNFALSLFALACSGAFDGVSMIVRRAVMRQFSPEGMRGRIAAVGNIFVGASNELGALESGVTAKLFGTAASVLYGGCLTLIVVGFTAWRAPKLRTLDLSNPEPDTV